MSSYIELPCGCKLSEAYVLGMCITHADELQRRKVADRKAAENLQQRMIGDVEKALGFPGPMPAFQQFDCHKCANGKTTMYMILCPICGNKRCPKASDHTLECTNSNAPGQPGSVY